MSEETIKPENPNDNAGGGESNDPIGDMFDAAQEVEALRAEKAAVYEKLARVQADFTNSRKRLETEFEQRFAYANQTLIEQLLPVVDNFDRALSQDPSKVDAATFHKGLSLVAEQFHAVMSKYGVQELAPKPGDDFDPTLHQAIMQQESAEHAEGKVTMLLQKGYTIKERVVRAAQVAVAKGN